MPLREEEIKSMRNIVKLYRSGMTVKKVSEVTRCTNGHVRRVLTGNK